MPGPVLGCTASLLPADGRALLLAARLVILPGSNMFESTPPDQDRIGAEVRAGAAQQPGSGHLRLHQWPTM
jgi:hypothetical protein